MQRQEEPYPSNCTKSWTRTNFTELMNDPPVDGEMDDDALRYNLAVKAIFLSYFELTNLVYVWLILTLVIIYSPFVFIYRNAKESVYSVALWLIANAFILFILILNIWDNVKLETSQHLTWWYVISSKEVIKMMSEKGIFNNVLRICLWSYMIFHL